MQVLLIIAWILLILISHLGAIALTSNGFEDGSSGYLFLAILVLIAAWFLGFTFGYATRDFLQEKMGMPEESAEKLENFINKHSLIMIVWLVILIISALAHC